MKPEVVTIGLGYIGLPTSALIAKYRTKVLGVDINKHVVDTINKGKIHIVEPDLEKIVFEAVSDGFFKASTKVIPAKVYLIVVPTPFKGDYEPDISFVEDATNLVIPILKQGDLFIIESTSPVGTTEKMEELIYASRPELKGKIYIAYCPERVLPGNVIHELVYNDRVIGGINEDSTKKAITFYSKYVKGKLHPTDARTAEMCKLVENSSRDVQIAFANELSLICEKANIDVWKLIDLANKHPRVNILSPGCGVGGHCIAVDPYFISSQFPNESKIISQARDINNYKPNWCFEKIKEEVKSMQKNIKRKLKIGIFGLTFKPDIDDIRQSPAMEIAQKIHETYGSDSYMVEPNLSNLKQFKLTDYNIAYKESDIVIFLVNHSKFKSINIDLSNKKIIDFCGITQ